MAIQWADNFSRYGTGSASRTAMLDGLPYASIGDNPSGNGRCITDPDPLVPSGSRCFRLGTLSNDWSDDFRVALPSPSSGVHGVAFRVWMNNLPVSTEGRQNIVAFMTVAGVVLAKVRVEQNGSLTVQETGGATIGDTIVPVLAPNTWFHLEVKYDSGTGAGSIYVNGVSRLTFTGGDTGIVAITNMSSRSGDSSSTTTNIKDAVYWDGTGTENNDVLGTVIVGRLKPTSDVTLGGWLPSTGSTGFDLLAKDAPNDTTYLSADDTPPAQMEYHFEDLPPDVTSVKAVLTVGRMRKIDGGDANVQMSLISNGDTDLGADRPVTSAFSYWFDVSELSPDTAAPWNPIELNNTTAAIDRTL